MGNPSKDGFGVPFEVDKKSKHYYDIPTKQSSEFPGQPRH
jgi:hypothetical protein